MTDELPLSARKRRESLDSPGSRTVDSMQRVNEFLEQPIQAGSLSRESLEGGVQAVFEALNEQIDEDQIGDEPVADQLQTCVQRCVLMVARRVDEDVTKFATGVIESQLKVSEQSQIIDEMSAVIASQNASSVERTAIFNTVLEQQKATIDRLEKSRSAVAVHGGHICQISLGGHISQISLHPLDRDPKR